MMKQNNTFGAVWAGLGGGLIFLLFFVVLSINLVVSLLAAFGVIVATILLVRPNGDGMDIDFTAYGVTSEELKEVLRTGLEKQQRLKELQKRVPKREIRESVEKIIDVVDRIYEDFKKDPKDIRTGRMFLNNYLDSTLTIIEKYVDLVSHKVRGGELEKTLQKTEELLDKIHRAFELQLSKLLEDDALDLSTEIEVLEKTLKMEGLDTNA